MFDISDNSIIVEHEASSSSIAAEQLFYYRQRGNGLSEAISSFAEGFCSAVFSMLPFEFASEVNRVLSLKLSGSVG